MWFDNIKKKGIGKQPRIISKIENIMSDGKKRTSEQVAVELNKTERISPTSRQVAQWLTNNYEYIEGSVPRLYYR
jgi:hypothetical protein|tara:strand:+ start:264 stop:488 length:225 start_codon:yes stop_codon:yes gene_type:complete